MNCPLKTFPLLLHAGPGMDFFEQFYVMGSAIEVLLGSPFEHARMMRAPLIASRFMPDPNERWTVEFNDFVDDKPSKRCLLDHIFLSPNLFQATSKAGIAHQLMEQNSSGRERQDRPSDHRPVFADML